MSVSISIQSRRYPEPAAMLRLIKPITWFPPIWAYLCGSVSAGVPLSGNWGMVLLGMALAGPIVCGMSQAANDWCDRHVDAVNEPDRPIPSGRIPGRWGLYIALAMTALSLWVGSLLGTWGFWATVVGVVAAWAYSAEPVRLKRSGWWGPGLVGLSYEGLPWFTGAAVLLQAAPRFEIVIIALLYSIGAHGIMTLNDFKALEGDPTIGSLTVAEALVIPLLALWGKPWHALGVFAVLLLQIAAMRVLFRDPKGKAPWYNGTGVVLYVTGMMISAFALRGLA